MAGKGRWQRSKSMSVRSARRRAAPLRKQALLFAALGDEMRLQIVTRLGAHGPLSIVNLTEGTGVTRQAITKHLQVLSRAGFVRGRRVGRETLWRLEPVQLDAARASLERISAQWDVGLARLKDFVEK
jgi:DNA-binding transcriptional ArsR family regulator